MEQEDKKSSPRKPFWRKLSASDITDLIAVADKIHPDLHESYEVFAERVKLSPEGCLALVEPRSVELCGYAISHPIIRGHPPALNSLLGQLPLHADQYYIHDLVILPAYQGRGLAQECVKELLAIARRYPTTGLVSVYGTAPFWGRFGFLPEKVDCVVKKKLADYGPDAVYLERKNVDDAGPPNENWGRVNFS